MNKGIGFLILLLIFAASCPGGPVVPTDHPGGEHEPSAFCIDFERANNDAAVNGANAALLYRNLGVTFPSNPEIINNGALCGGAGPVPGPIRNQCLFQGDPDAARPERSCGPLEIRFDPGLEVGKVEFEARNVGFISTPVDILAIAFGEVDGAEVEIDEVRRLSRSEFGDLRPVELITLRSEPSEPPITKVVIRYGTERPTIPEGETEPVEDTTCRPTHVVINDLCIEPKDRTVGTIGQSDSGADRLVYYFDNYGGESSIQLANLSNEVVDVHVQIWIVNSTIHACEEIDFYDTYTPKDVHTYDTLDWQGNNGASLGIGDSLAGKYGFIVISKSDGPDNSLIGSMRIFHYNGFEFSTNAVAPEAVKTASNKYGAVNFNNINGHRYSELIGFTYTVIAEDTVYASSGITTTFGSPTDPIQLFDENEEIISCSPQQFSCSEGNANVGIDLSLSNTDIICLTRIISPTNSAGWMKLPFGDTICTDPAVGGEDGNCMHDTYFVGFFGLTGSNVLADIANYGIFDSWWGGKTTDEE